mmetsp:Transcript_13275/g.36645  ORF Transcript_13275/g.36645 Transcript_13275/m.36645 type:complete len:100 (+) Transcript_13275:684-983(+)
MVTHETRAMKEFCTHHPEQLKSPECQKQTRQTHATEFWQSSGARVDRMPPKLPRRNVDALIQRATFLLSTSTADSRSSGGTPLFILASSHDDSRETWLP